MLYRKRNTGFKVVEAEALLFFDNPTRLSAISKLVGKDIIVTYATEEPILLFTRDDGVALSAKEGDWVVKDDNGELVIYSPEDFVKNYRTLFPLMRIE